MPHRDRQVLLSSLQCAECNVRVTLVEGEVAGRVALLKQHRAGLSGLGGSVDAAGRHQARRLERDAAVDEGYADWKEREAAMAQRLMDLELRNSMLAARLEEQQAAGYAAGAPAGSPHSTTAHVYTADLPPEVLREVLLVRQLALHTESRLVAAHLHALDAAPRSPRHAAEAGERLRKEVVAAEGSRLREVTLLLERVESAGP